MGKTFDKPDAEEASRKLTKAEQRRLEAFEKMSEEKIAAGYRRTNLTIGIVKANVFAIVLLIPVAIIGLVLYFWKNGFNLGGMDFSNYLLFMIAFLVLIVVHELIHGVSWAIFSEHHFKDIEFGFMWKYLTPYCTCSVPLSKGQYIFGALMPMFLLGIVPMIVGILTGWFLWLLIGIIMTDAAAGDIMIVWNILNYKTTAQEFVYVDHPTQAGGVIFER